MTEQRTPQQNRSLHAWCEMLSQEYTEQGMTLQTILEQATTEIYPTKLSVKEAIIKPIIKNMYGYTSTTQIKKDEVDEIVDVVTKLNAKMGIDYIPWPAKCDECGGGEEHVVGCPEA